MCSSDLVDAGKAGTGGRGEPVQVRAGGETEREGDGKGRDRGMAGHRASSSGDDNQNLNQSSLSGVVFPVLWSCVLGLEKREACTGCSGSVSEPQGGLMAISVDLSQCNKNGYCYGAKGCPEVFGMRPDGRAYVKVPGHPVDSCVLNAQAGCCQGAILTS